MRIPPRGARVPHVLACAIVLLAALQDRAAAQDQNIMLSIAEIETRLRDQPFRVLDWRGSRRPEDRTQRVTIAFEDSTVMRIKWANAPANGGAFNNQPRYEAAAYEIQKLFLEEDEYVVPPTLLRAFPIDYVREQMPEVKPTFENARGSVLVALQYWLGSVTSQNFWVPERARTDTAYARRIGNFNILTFLIRHSDANVGNYLISTAPEKPRVFSVDNGIAFSSNDSDRGTHWRELNVERFPRTTIERLSRVTREQLEQALGVLAEYEVRAGTLVPVAPGPNLGRNVGVRRTDDRVQLGLTTNEIREVYNRINELLRTANGRRLF